MKICLPKKVLRPLLLEFGVPINDSVNAQAYKKDGLIVFVFKLGKLDWSYTVVLDPGITFSSFTNEVRHYVGMAQIVLMQGVLNLIKKGEEEQPDKKNEVPQAKKLSVEQAMELEPVPLVDAMFLGQPVFGTSSTSRYFLVASSKDANMALRLKGNNLSLRIEFKSSQIAPSLEQKLKELDLSKKGSGHWSMHLSVADPKKDAQKIFGAVAYATTIEWSEIVPDISVFIDKGC